MLKRKKCHCFRFIVLGNEYVPHLCQPWESVTHCFEKEFKSDEITCSQLGRFLDSKAVRGGGGLAGCLDE